MLIVSWNVAGWSTTIDKISKTHKEWAEGDVVSKYIESLEADIFCIQEVKLEKSKLESQARR